LVLTKSDILLHGGASGFTAGVCAADATGRLRTAAAPKAPAMAAPNQGLSPMTLLLDVSCALVWLAGQAIAHMDARIHVRLRASTRLRRRSYQA
jgi:hypothetical protein